MKLPRYTTGRTNVAELSAARAAVRSPSEVARVQQAKFGAVATGLAGIGEVAAKISEVRQKAQLAKDEITFDTNENNITSAYKLLQNDPNLDKPIQDDGTPTAEYFKRESEALIATYRKGVSDIENPEAKKRAEQLIAQREQKLRADMEGDLGVIESRVAEGTFIDSMEESLALGNTDGAKSLLTTAYKNGLVDAKGRVKWSERIEKDANQQAAQERIDYINEGFSVSEEEGNKRLSETIKDKSLSQEVRDMAIDGGEEKASEWGKARDDEVKAAEVTAILSFGNDSEKAKFGLMSYAQVDAAYSSGRYGDPKSVGAANKRNQLFGKITTAVDKKEVEMNIRETYESGRFMLDDKKHRDALSEYEDEVTSEMEPRDRLATIGEMSRTLGTVSTNTENILNTASKSEAALMQNLSLYRELTSDEKVQPTLHINAESESALEDASTLMDAGVGQTEAATIAFKNQNPSELEKVQRDESWRMSEVESANKNYTNLLDSDIYEEPGFGNVEDPPALMQVEYGAIYKAVYMQTGNSLAAKNTADRAISRTWVMSNFNSADPDEYTVEKNGIPGDSRRIRSGIITEIDAETYRIRKNDGTYKTGRIDPEKVTFRPIDTDENGNRVYGVEHDGVPLYRVTDNGIEVATYVLDESKVSEYQDKTARLEVTQKRISDIKLEESRLSQAVERNPYINIPGRIKKQKQRLGVLGKERQRLEKEVPEMTVKF